MRLKRVTVCLNNAKHKITPNQCSVYDMRDNSNKQFIFTTGSRFLSGGKNQHGYTGPEQQIRTRVHFQYTALLREHLALLMILKFFIQKIETFHLWKERASHREIADLNLRKNEERSFTWILSYREKIYLFKRKKGETSLHLNGFFWPVCYALSADGLYRKFNWQLGDPWNTNETKETPQMENKHAKKTKSIQNDAQVRSFFPSAFPLSDSVIQCFMSPAWIGDCTYIAAYAVR